jgi:hypothetical protein
VEGGKWGGWVGVEMRKSVTHTRVEEKKERGSVFALTFCLAPSLCCFSYCHCRGFAAVVCSLLVGLETSYVGCVADI